MLPQSLPTEVLLNIFDFIKDTKQLMECRLVSKPWVLVAEMAALGRSINLKDKEQVLKFLYYMKKSPNARRSLKILTIADVYVVDEPEDDDLLDHCKELLPLIFTPKLEMLAGNVLGDNDSYNRMWTIISENPSVKFGLKRIPCPIEQSSLEYRKTVLCLTETLQYLYLQLPSQEPLLAESNFFIEKLGRFKCLQSLNLTIERKDFPALKSIVNSCSQLKILNIGWIEKDIVTTRQEVQDWFKRYDTKNDSSLKILKIENCFSWVPIEYLFLKYQKIDNVLIDLRSIVLEEDDSDYDRLMDTLKKVPVCEFVLPYGNFGRTISNFISRARIDNKTTEIATDRDNDMVRLKFTLKQD